MSNRDPGDAAVEVGSLLEGIADDEAGLQSAFSVLNRLPGAAVGPVLARYEYHEQLALLVRAWTARDVAAGDGGGR